MKYWESSWQRVIDNTKGNFILWLITNTTIYMFIFLNLTFITDMDSRTLHAAIVIIALIIQNEIDNAFE